MSFIATILSFVLEVLTTVAGIKVFQWLDKRKQFKSAKKKAGS